MISKWKELHGKQSRYYIIEKSKNNEYGAWIINKRNRKERYYLSTHFFYNSKATAIGFDRLLRQCGFKLKIKRV